MESITGKTDGFTRAISTTTSEAASVNYTTWTKWSIEVIGSRDNRLTNK